MKTLLNNNVFFEIIVINLIHHTMFTVALLSVRRCALALLTLALAACSAPEPPGPADEARATQMRPHNAALAEKYERSCMVCHTQAAAKAPLTGFAPAWQPRLKQGMDTLVRHAEQGLGGMPARGLCADCTADDLRALIRFMAQ